MTRIPLRQEDQFVEKLKNLREYIRSIKAPQRVGASSMILQRIESENTWDVTATVLGTAHQATWRVRFYPETEKQAYSQLEVTWDYTHPDGEVISFDDPDDAASSVSKSWIVGLIPNYSLSSATLRLKFAVRSTSKGYFEWTRLT